MTVSLTPAAPETDAHSPAVADEPRLLQRKRAGTSSREKKLQAAVTPSVARDSAGSSNGTAFTQQNAHVNVRFELDARVAQEFNAYALAMHPKEVGGLLRLEEIAPHHWRAVELRVFPHLAASATYFELDGTAVAQFNMELVRSGRQEEMSQWKALIHSHPDMTPRMSQTDIENLERLAGDTYAFSVICGTQRGNPQHNDYAVHYGQGNPMPMWVSDLDVHAHGGNNELIGLDLLSDEELTAITQNVRAACELELGDDELVYARDHPVRRATRTRSRQTSFASTSGNTRKQLSRPGRSSASADPRRLSTKADPAYVDRPLPQLLTPEDAAACAAIVKQARCPKHYRAGRETLLSHFAAMERSQSGGWPPEPLNWRQFGLLGALLFTQLMHDRRTQPNPAQQMFNRLSQFPATVVRPQRDASEHGPVLLDGIDTSDQRAIALQVIMRALRQDRDRYGYAEALFADVMTSRPLYRSQALRLQAFLDDALLDAKPTSRTLHTQLQSLHAYLRSNAQENASTDGDSAPAAANNARQVLNETEDDTPTSAAADTDATGSSQPDDAAENEAPGGEICELSEATRATLLNEIPAVAGNGDDDVPILRVCKSLSSGRTQVHASMVHALMGALLRARRRYRLEDYLPEQHEDVHCHRAAIQDALSELNRFVLA